MLVSNDVQPCRVVFLSAGLVMMQQLSGINALIYYSTAVFSAAGLSSPVIGTVLLAVVNLLGESRIQLPSSLRLYMIDVRCRQH